jgi:hypothetical protein
MDIEMALHEKKGTWELQKPPLGANVMASKWVYDVDEAGRRKAELAKVWDIKDVGGTQRLLGMRVEQNLKVGTVTLSQRSYFEKVLADHNLQNIRLRTTPLPVGLVLTSDMCPTTPEDRQQMVGKPYRVLLGSSIVLSRFQINPGIQHWQALLHFMGYIANTLDYGITYSRDAGDLIPHGYIDTDYAGCQDTRRSTSGQVFLMAGAPVSWASKRQATVALSTVEAEYISLTRGAQQLKWMYAWMAEAQLEQSLPGVLYCDNRGAVDLTKTTKSHSKVKHIDIRHHFIRELVHEGELKVEPVCGDANPADLFTKPLLRQLHEKYLTELNIGPIATQSTYPPGLGEC